MNRWASVIVAVGGLTSIGLAAALQYDWAVAPLLLTLVAVVVPIDVRERRIPADAVATGGLLFLAMVVVTMSVGDLERAANASGGATLVTLAFLAIHLLAPTKIGFGDVRLAPLAFGAVGYTAGVSASVGAAAVASAIAAAFALASRQRAVPFAPFLLLSAFSAVSLAAAA